MYKALTMACIMMVCGAVFAGNQATISIDGGHKSVEPNGAHLLTLGLHNDYQMSLSAPGSPSNIKIDGRDTFKLARMGESQSMTVVNGHTQVNVTYSFSLQPLATGSYTLGPATVTVNGQIYESNRIRIKVVDQVTYDQLDRAAGRAGSALSCRVEITPTDAVVGEALTARVILEDDGLALERRLEEPNFNGMTITKEDETQAENVVEDGKSLMRYTKTYHLLPDTPGTYKLGATRALFTVRDKTSRNNPFGGMGSMFGSLASTMFGGGVKKKVVVADPITVTINELPETGHHVDGVGEFTRLSVRVDKTDVELNEPITLKAALTGNGNFDAIVAPSIAVPDDMTVYESGNTIEKVAGGHRKTFEYVLQVNKAGSFIVPEQEFVYFDVKKREYRKIRSSSIVINVKGDTSAPAAAAGRADSGQTPPSPLASPQAAPSAALAKLTAFLAGGVSWWLFLVLVLLLLGIGLREQLADGWRRFAELSGITSAYKRDKAQLDRIIKSGNTPELYRFFTALLAGWWACDAQGVDSARIEREVAAWAWDIKKKEGFLAYLDLCSQVAFAAQAVGAKEQGKLLKKAEYWLEIVYAARQGGRHE